jgi:hypothetical protein
VFGASELELLEDMRKRARELGADAIIRTESQRWYQPPVAVYDPLYDPFFFPRRYHPYRPYWPPYSGYRLAGGGYYYTAQAVAIKYQPVSEVAPVPAPAVPEKPERPES